MGSLVIFIRGKSRNVNQNQNGSSTTTTETSLYSLPVTGHVIPLCGIATLFASRGQHVTVITTPYYAQILRKSSPSLQLHVVDFPAKDVGLPDGVEIKSAVTDLADTAKFYQAAMLLRRPISHFMDQHPPDCIVADTIASYHTPNSIPTRALSSSPIFLTASPCPPDHPRWPPPSWIISSNRAQEPRPHREQLRRAGRRRVHPALREKHGSQAWHLGPACLVGKRDQERGEKSVVSQNECLTWLDPKPTNSVVYVSFGSVCHFPDKQLYEIACALEQSGKSFIWIVPEKKGKEYENESEEEKEKWLPKGFLRGNREKGMIVKGWAPQLLILAHPAVGGFLSHCGWNSSLEAVTAGVPMITWPVMADQFYNEKLITEVRGIGVEVGATEWRLVGYGEREKLVTRDTIETAIKRLMGGGDEAQNIRRRSEELAEKAKQSLQEGGSSHNRLTTLIADLMRLRDSKSAT
ncbi:hypothetical protein JHK86_019849 [Glycine max]|nr:hypothetical protein JHK86_019849 [Glycine max]